MTRILTRLLLLLPCLIAACSPSGLQSGTLPPPTIQPTDIPPTNPPPPAAPTASPTPAPTFAPTQLPTSATLDSSGWIAYIGEEGNLWLVNANSGEQRQLTQDAIPWQASGDVQQEQVITYCCPEWSSDGQWLAYRRDTGTQVESGYEYSYELIVHELASDDSFPILADQQVAGFSWQPGALTLTYGLLIDPQYFIAQPPVPGAEYLTGIWSIDVPTGEPTERVPPERGYSLVNPRWSPDGRFLSFEEVLYIEGRGQFAYYDVPAKQYVAWEDVIGLYSWSPDGEQIAYDRLAYIPTGQERIWLRERQGGEERPLSPELPSGYAFNPLISPLGDLVAYWTQPGGFESQEYTLFVIPVAGGEARPLGTYQQVQGFSWSPDGQQLAFSAGPYEAQQILVVSVVDGIARTLAIGGQPVWQPGSP